MIKLLFFIPLLVWGGSVDEDYQALGRGMDGISMGPVRMLRVPFGSGIEQRFKPIKLNQLPVKQAAPLPVDTSAPADITAQDALGDVLGVMYLIRNNHPDVATNRDLRDSALQD